MSGGRGDRGDGKEKKLDCKVYVGDLGYGAAKQELEDIFSRYGPLKNVWVARNPPGFAFVEYEDPRDAEDACKALDGTRMNGRRVRAEMSSGKSRWGSRGPPVRRGGGGGGGGYRGGGGGYGGGGGGGGGGSWGGGGRRRSRSRSPPVRRRPRSSSRSRSGSADRSNNWSQRDTSRRERKDSSGGKARSPR